MITITINIYTVKQNIQKLIYLIWHIYIQRVKFICNALWNEKIVYKNNNIRANTLHSLKQGISVNEHVVGDWGY